MDGCVLEDAMRPEALQTRPIRREAPAKTTLSPSSEISLSPDEAASVREQLRNLGYID
jgi:hypothetical protein